MSVNDNHPKVFISYSQDSEDRVNSKDYNGKLRG